MATTQPRFSAYRASWLHSAGEARVSTTPNPSSEASVMRAVGAQGKSSGQSASGARASSTRSSCRTDVHKGNLASGLYRAIIT